MNVYLNCESLHGYSTRDPIHMSGIAAIAGPPLPAKCDAVETQPLEDIKAMPVPTDSLLPASSPEVSSSKLRTAYQLKISKPHPPGDAALPPATLVSVHHDCLTVFITNIFPGQTRCT